MMISMKSRFKMKWLTLRQAAWKAGMDIITIRSLVNAGVIPSIVMGEGVRAPRLIHEVELLEFLKTCDDVS